MSEEQLDSSQVARLLVNLGRLRPPHRVRAVGRAIKPGALDPAMDDPRILSCGEVRLRLEAARKEILSVAGFELGKPGAD
jgi:hypothetical protein